MVEASLLSPFFSSLSLLAVALPLSLSLSLSLFFFFLAGNRQTQGEEEEADGFLRNFPFGKVSNFIIQVLEVHPLLPPYSLILSLRSFLFFNLVVPTFSN